MSSFNPVQQSHNIMITNEVQSPTRGGAKRAAPPLVDNWTSFVILAVAINLLVCFPELFFSRFCNTIG